jgi:sugar/nucleoside kinase (ribokinase family)
MGKFVIGIGEALWDMLPEGKKLGGAPANFAYHASQFGHEAIAVSAIGQDKLGEEIVEALEEHRLPYHLDRVEYPTGTVQVTLDAQGVPQYEIKTDVAWDNIPYTKELAALAADCKAVCFIDGEYTVKRVEIGPQGAVLVPCNEHNRKFKPIPVGPDNDFLIWGVVTWVIKKA